jgi:response regulator RpfG family c-di-GMP phosphodiesterase
MEEGTFIQALKHSTQAMENDRSLWKTGRPRCLVVDDDPAGIALVRAHLHSYDIEIIGAESGEDALAEIEQTIPDCVLLDVMMPGMNGYQVCDEIKTRWPDEHIPVIMLTALRGRRGKIRALEAGADDFLQKPAQPVEIIARLRSSLAARELHLKLSDKMLQVETLQKQRASELEQLTQFLTFADQSLSRFEPKGYGLETELQTVVGHLLKSSSHDGDQPAQVFIGMRSDNGDYEGFVYSSKDDGIQRHPGPIVLPSKGAAALFEGGRDVSYANRPCSAPLNFFKSQFDCALGRIVSPVQNYVAYTGGQIGVVTFNHKFDVGDFSAHLLRSIVMYSNVVKSLADQSNETEDSFIYAIGALARASEANDEDTGNHIIRVNEYSRELAVALGCSPTYVRQIHYSAQMHDVGKIHIPREILRKQGPLTDEEWTEMKKHTLYGAKILGDSPRLQLAREIALAHHEKHDGSGYPYGLLGEEIPLSARIVAVADIYDALRSRRPYKPAFSHDKAIDILINGDDRVKPAHFDPQVIEAFKRHSSMFAEIYYSLRDEPEEVDAVPA